MAGLDSGVGVKELPMLKNQMEKTMENKMDIGVAQAFIGISDHYHVEVYLRYLVLYTKFGIMVLAFIWALQLEWI